ncbi:MAG: hypothetical protein M1827_006072 [Pycnora praestabilis]|nr:MAG: hypothetical protein M1827_006072 [Pycnora praestabilis]
MTSDKEKSLDNSDQARRSPPSSVDLPASEQPQVEKTIAVEAEAPPNGGFKAWSQVVGSFFLFFNSWGIINAFGVYQTYYETGLLKNESPSNISWIGSIQAFLLLIIGVVTGPIYDAGYFYALVWTGSFLVIFGVMMTSLCTEYWQIMLAQAVTVGIGSGCIFVPSVAIIPQYFTTRKAFATGIAASGSSLGGIIYPILFYKLQPQIGFAWATRVIGFMALGLLSIALSLMRIRVLPKQKRAFLELPAFKEPPYIMFTIGMFFGFIGLYTPIFYIQTYAIQEHITNTNLGFYMLPILNAASVFGRVVPNFYADRTGPLNMLIPCSLAASILTYAWIGIKNTPGLIVYALLFGFFSGTFVSLPPTAIVSLSPHLGVVGTRMGMAFTIASLGLLIGTPVSGAILNTTGKYIGPQALAASTLMAAAVFMSLARYKKVGLKVFKKA